MPSYDYTRPTTTLEAVNIILASIGQVPVASLDATSTNIDAEVALNRLMQASRSVQKNGWHFNQNMGQVLEANLAGEVRIPENTLKVRQARMRGLATERDLVVRGERLFDRLKQTFNIGSAVEADITVCLDFEDLPESARWYITLKAARQFATGRLPNSSIYQFTKQDEEEAQVEFEQDDAETDQRTLASNPHIQRMRRR